MHRIASLIAGLTLIANLAGGCASMRFTDPEGETVREAYAGGKDDRGPGITVADTPSPTARARVVPLMHPPDAFAVYVPQHPDPENKMWVGDHWIYIELSPGGFFAEPVVEGTPGARENASDADALELKDRLAGLKHVAVPYKRSAK